MFTVVSSVTTNWNAMGQELLTMLQGAGFTLLRSVQDDRYGNKYVMKSPEQQVFEYQAYIYNRDYAINIWWYKDDTTLVSGKLNNTKYCDADAMDGSAAITATLFKADIATGAALYLLKLEMSQTYDGCGAYMLFGVLRNDISTGGDKVSLFSGTFDTPSKNEWMTGNDSYGRYFFTPVNSSRSVSDGRTMIMWEGNVPNSVIQPVFHSNVHENFYDGQSCTMGLAGTPTARVPLSPGGGVPMFDCGIFAQTPDLIAHYVGTIPFIKSIATQLPDGSVIEKGGEQYMVINTLMNYDRGDAYAVHLAKD